MGSIIIKVPSVWGFILPGSKDAAVKLPNALGRHGGEDRSNINMNSFCACGMIQALCLFVSIKFY